MFILISIIIALIIWMFIRKKNNSKKEGSIEEGSPINLSSINDDSNSTSKSSDKENITIMNTNSGDHYKNTGEVLTKPIVTVEMQYSSESSRNETPIKQNSRPKECFELLPVSTEFNPNSLINQTANLVNPSTGYPMLSNKEIESVEKAKENKQAFKDSILNSRRNLTKLYLKAAQHGITQYSGEINRNIYFIISIKIELQGLYYFVVGDWNNAEKEWLKIVYYSECALLGLKKIYNYQHRYKDEMRVMRTYYYFARNLDLDKSKLELIRMRRDYSRDFAKENKKSDKSIFKNYQEFDNASRKIAEKNAKLHRDIDNKRLTSEDLAYFDRDIRRAKQAGFTKMIWHTVHDKRVCEKCREKENKIFSIDDSPKLRNFKKKHGACRCYIEFL